MPNEPTRKPAQRKPTPRLEQRADKHARGNEVVTTERRIEFEQRLLAKQQRGRPPSI